MKTNMKFIKVLALSILTVVFVGCKDDDEPDIPNAAEFDQVQDIALAAETQTFTIDASAGTVQVTSEAGVVLTINGAALTKNGSPVTGNVTVEFVEIFDKGKMLVTNKPTMGEMADGKKTLLKTGGEFFIRATQGGVELETTQALTLLVPTTAVDQDMKLFIGDAADPENLVWKQDSTGGAGANKGVRGEGANNYMVTFGNFGWTNVDKFYSDPRPKTTIQVAAPAGYNDGNCAIYLSYDGEGTNALAKLDTYFAGIFSEHYGQIPVGLACHIIFTTCENGKWKWAIKGVTTTANATYVFTEGETTTGTEAQLVAAVNAIQ